MFSLKTLAGLAAVAALALPVTAFAQSVTSVQIKGHAPTEVRIDLAGKPAVAVKQEIRVAAGTVCRNAARNGDLEFYDVAWCSRATQVKALSRYTAIVKHNSAQLADGGEFTLAVR